MKLRSSLVLVVSLCGIFFLGCGKSDPNYFGTIKPLHPPDEIWLNNSNEPEWLDPGKCSETTGGEVIWNTFAGLAELHPSTLEPMPDIAENWQLSDDARTYTFQLRPSKWSDGTALTAHDFEWSWKRVLDPKTASKYSIIMYPIKNADAFNQQALVATGFPIDASEEQVTKWAEEILPVERIKRDKDRFFLFVSEGEGDALSRIEAAEQLDGRQFESTTIRVAMCDSSVVGVEAVDDQTLVVRLEHPVPYFLNLTGFYTFMPVPRHLLEQLEADDINPDLWTRPEHFVCNGPYRLVEWKFRQYMLFEKNERYWNQAPHLCRAKKVRALMVESYNTALNLYCGGEIDWLGGQAMIPSEFMDRMKNYKDYDNSRYLGVYFYWFNTTAPPLDDARVRRALSLAIDREKITSFVTRAGQIPMSTVVPNGLAGYEAIEQPLFDPETAKQLLAEAGYPEGKNLPPITLIYNTTEQHKQIASAAQQMWKDNLGIQVNIENQEWKVYLNRLKQMDFQIARMGWIGDYADPNTFLELFASNNGNNHSNFADPNYDKLLLEANKAVDPQERLALLREAEEYAFEHQPILPIYVYTKPTMVKPFLRGFHGNDMDRHQWKYFWIDEGWYNGVPAEIQGNPIAPVVPQSNMGNTP